MRALITGHRGFIGRHFYDRLETDGWEVAGADIADRDTPTDARDIFRYSRRVHYDLVVHAAAVVGGREMIENRPLAQAVNFELDAGLFSWAQQTGQGRVIYFSSSAAYPARIQNSHSRVRLHEDMIDPATPALPDELYGWAKLTGERLAGLARRAGMAVTVVRPFSGYGEDQDTGYPFGAFADRASRREDPFTIWGDGSQIRDFVHVDDIVDATLILARAGVESPVNIGWGEPVSMMSLARQFTQAAGYSPEFKPLTDAPSGVSYRVCDPTRLRLYCKPRVSLAEGIRRAVER